MAEPDTYRGMRHYVDEAAGAMGADDAGPMTPVTLARRSRALQLIESQIVAASRVPEADRPAILAHAADLIRSLALAHRAGERMLAAARAALGVPAPHETPAAPPKGETTMPDAPQDRPRPAAGSAAATPAATGPVQPTPLAPAVDPPLYHPTEGIDADQPALGTVDSQQQVDVPPDARAPQNTGLDRPRPTTRTAQEKPGTAAGHERPPDAAPPDAAAPAQGPEPARTAAPAAAPAARTQPASAPRDAGTTPARTPPPGTAPAPQEGGPTPSPTRRPR